MQPDVLILGLASDGIIALAYLTISITFVYFLRKRTDLRFNWMFLCFVAFIIAGGSTHAMKIWSTWHPSSDWSFGAVKAAAALVSLTTSFLFIRFLPRALRLPTPSALQQSYRAMQQEAADRTRAENELGKMYKTLEARVAERTTQLAELNRTLTQDNERSALAADAAGLGFWNWDIAAGVLQWDPRMVQLYGRSLPAGKAPLTAWGGCLHPEDRDRFARESSEALDCARRFDNEFRVIHPNGAIRYLKSVARIMRGADGRAVRVHGVTVDITDMKRADERFHLAIEAAPTGMLVMDRTGKIVLVNVQVEKLFGYSREELLGGQIETLVPQRFQHHHPELRISYFEDPKTRTMGGGRELFGLCKDGREVPIEIGLNPMHTSEGDFVLGSIVDLSQRMEIDRMRSEFVSTVSHELRTPLTSISGSLALLQSGALGSLPGKAATMVRIAYKNSERLVRLINDILDIGKLEAGQLSLQLVAVPVSELLRQSVEINSVYAEKYQVRFLLDGGPADDRVMADPDRLMQVVTNLLSNAAKFSPPGADVLIRLLPGATTLRIEVEDSGPGIPEAFQVHIFEKFAQADASPTRRIEGTGLGLSIARKLVEAMGGSIGFTTRTGRGTIFHLELRRTVAESIVPRIASPPMASPPIVAPSETALPRVLIVEDDKDLISVISATLANKVQTVAAHTLKEAELLLRKEQFELVILDQTLPDGEGLSLVDRIPTPTERNAPTVIFLATDPPRSVPRKVSAVLVKSQISAAQAAAAILDYLPANRQ